VYKVYVSQQGDSFNQEEYDSLVLENTFAMEQDRDALRFSGEKVRVRHKDCGQIHIFYVKRLE